MQAVHFENIVNCIITNPDIKLSKIDMLSKDERDTLLFELNDTSNEYPENKALHRLFEDQVYKTPENVALIFKQNSISYRELNRKANRLARKLRNRGAGNGKVVAILMENSIEMIISIIGVLKSGSAYLPIDLTHPFERIKYMLHDSKANILLLKSDYTYNIDVNCQKIF